MVHSITRLFIRLFAWTALSVISVDVMATTDPLDPLVNHTVTRTDTTVFTADGVNTGGTEYNDADHMLELGGSDYMEAKVYYKRYRHSATGQEELRIYFSVHDIAEDSDDRIDFYFDRLHNHGSTGDAELNEDLLLRITRNACSPPSCSFSRISRSDGVFGGTGSAVNIINAVVSINNAGEYAGAETGFQLGWTGEFTLTPANLGWSYFPQDLGHLVIARSEGQNAISSANGLPGSPANPSATYPLNGGSIVSANNTAANWGNLKLRYPIDYAVVMDFSGSMLLTDEGTETRWTQAKRAADLFVASLGLFKSDMLQDQISISQYSWSCSDDDSSGDSTGAVSGLGGKLTPGDIPAVPTGTSSYTSDNGVDPDWNNCTPIKAGIDYSLANQLNIAGSSADDKQDRIMILLSDGLHNTPFADVPFVPSTDFSSDEKAFTQVRTVALGDDGFADTTLLAEISTAFNGGTAYTYEAKYNQTSSFSDLLTAYLETLQAPLTINQVPKTGADYNPGAPDKLVFIGVWNNPANAVDLTLTLNGVVVNSSDYDSYVNTGVGFAAIAVDAPVANGAWEIGSTGALPDNEFVLADLRILARFLIEQKPYAAGDPMLLQVSLLDNGEPVSGADVTVEAAVPGEGLGNYLTTVGDDCEAHDPSIPKYSRDDQLILTHKTVGVNAAGTPAATQPAALAGDPQTGRYALSAYHFERCHKEGLDRNNLPGTKLYDDGTHGDLLADDGIYSLSYADTLLEGTYNFRFFALGTTTDGTEFARMRVVSQYVGIEPDSSSTATTVQPGPVIGGLASQLFYFLPEDALGNYMGPGFSHKFKVSTSTGYLYGDVIDLQNGYYLQTVRYAAGGSNPVVTITTTDGCFEKVVSIEGEHGSSACPPACATADYYYWCWIICVLIILLLLILLLICWLRKRR